MKAGLEVHQQLATGKLFCACPAELSEVVTAVADRRLRATGGENHQVDAAAAFQASRGLTYRYEATDTSCLVDLDEEPPHTINPHALDVALTMALLLHAHPLAEIPVMRKIVVDGSNTSGFQRTALIAVDGWVELGGRRYAIQTICLEEDAARRTGEEGTVTRFRLDRLGIPLVEIATGPEITTGPEARALAAEIGALLRATGRVRRGIGTIREDLNVSTEGGARVEIKGVQELKLIHRYVECEEERQRVLLVARDALRARGASVPDTPPVDLTALVASKLTGPVGETIRRGGVLHGIRLAGFAGQLGSAGQQAERLGRELAEQARAAGLRGILHSDELPGYGLEGETLEAIRRSLQSGAEDAFVLAAAPTAARTDAALARVADRARAALVGIPEETRDPLPDGRSRYSRPLPGRDRMYPETDVPPVPVTPEHLHRLTLHLPETPTATRERLAKELGIATDLIGQMQQADLLEEFQHLTARGHAPSTVARLLAQDLPAARASVGPATPDLPLPILDDVLTAVASGGFAKEGVPKVLSELFRGAEGTEAAAARAGFASLSAEELSALADRVVQGNQRLLDEKGDGAFSALMGDLMREVRGRRDGREVATVLRAAIARRASPTATG